MKINSYMSDSKSKDRVCEVCKHVHTLPQTITLDGKTYAVIACAECKHGAYQKVEKKN